MAVPACSVGMIDDNYERFGPIRCDFSDNSESRFHRLLKELHSSIPHMKSQSHRVYTCFKRMASLVSISGPLKGSTYQLTDLEVSIGRDGSNSLSILDPLLSRRHCIIRKEGNDYRLSDLNSRNGIFINNLPTSGAILQHGDEIEVGDSLFLFLSGEPTEPEIKAKLDQELIGTVTKQMSAEDASYLNTPPATDRSVRDLSILFKIGNAIHLIQDIQTLQKKLLQLTLEVIPAERGAILIAARNADSLEPSFTLDRNSNAVRDFHISKDIVQNAVSERTGILGESSKQQSILCVPLMIHNTLQGAFYFDGSRFDESHLQLVWGIASIAAIALKNANDRQHLIDENERLQASVELNMVGESPSMLQVHRIILKAAPKDSTVLICGESGTGKELVARAIHRNSSRANMPFVAINCASLTDTLLESELFGHEKGAFTGAIAQKKGKLEIADQGTVFLDEVSEIPINVQAKLLRVIQEREFERIGGIRPIHIDVRFIAATNKNLEQAIRTGSFRQDLFYRLNVIRIEVPPLRERDQDIALLAKYFVSRYSKSLQRRVKGISEEALDCLIHHDWPGNVRELENSIERAIVLGSAETILPEDLPDALVENSPKIKAGFLQGVKESKKKLVQKALQEAGGNYQEAAKILGVHPNYLYSLLRNLGIKRS